MDVSRCGGVEMTGYKSKKAAAQDKLMEKRKPIQWPFPVALRPTKPVGKLPFNSNNHEEAML